MNLNFINTMFVGFVIFTVALIVPLATPLSAMPEYAEKTRQGCKTCHITEDGGELLDRGLVYSASGYVWPPEGGYRVISPIGKPVRAVIGFLHIIAGFMWFGTILYVHLVLRPAYADKGLPRIEVAIGMVSMLIVGVSGVVMTISKIRGWEVLTGSQWGAVLLVKIVMYIAMISMAAIAVLFVGPKLHAPDRKAVAPKDGVFDPLTLANFNGKDGRPAYVAYKGKIYDLTSGQHWKKGLHFRHTAGTELTKAIADAPHDEDNLKGFEQVGEYDQTRKPPKTSAQKLFHLIAYTNLLLVFAVLFTIAYWRWGI
jgi:predicted heme/steroid binding protein